MQSTTTTLKPASQPATASTSTSTPTPSNPTSASSSKQQTTKQQQTKPQQGQQQSKAAAPGKLVFKTYTTSPYSLQGPQCMAKQDTAEILELLKRYTLQFPPKSNSRRSFLYIGAQACFTHFRKCAAIVVAQQVQPDAIFRHLATMSHVTSVPMLPLDCDSATLGASIGLNSAIVVGIRSPSAIPKEKQLPLELQQITTKAPAWNIPWIPKLPQLDSSHASKPSLTSDNAVVAAPTAAATSGTLQPLALVHVLATSKPNKQSKKVKRAARKTAELQRKTNTPATSTTPKSNPRTGRPSPSARRAELNAVQTRARQSLVNSNRPGLASTHAAKVASAAKISSSWLESLRATQRS